MGLLNKNESPRTEGRLLTAQCEEFGRCRCRRIQDMAIQRLNLQGLLEDLDALALAWTVRSQEEIDPTNRHERGERLHLYQAKWVTGQGDGDTRFP